MLHNDPNVRWAKKTIRLDFALWDYHLSVTRTVGGNCHGLSNLDGALISLYDDVCDEGIVLTRADGETLLCEDDEEKGEDWLLEMLVGAEIIAIEAEPNA